MRVDEKTCMAYKEVYRIIENSENEIKEKIPSKFINIIEMAMSKEYEPSIDYCKPLDEQYLMPQTFTILGLIYRDFLCSKEEKGILIEEEKEKLKIIEDEKNKKYNSENIFKNKSKSQENALVNTNIKEKWYHKILKKIMKIIKIGK